jgi:GTPase
LSELSAGSGRAVLVHIDFRNSEFNEDPDEFIELVTSAGITPVTILNCTRDVPNPRFYIGTGKVEDIKRDVGEAKADIVIFNHAINPGQQRNLERELGCRVIDRVELILDIFAQRARTYEGMLQVELAQLQHLSTRLIRGWTHLERQKGGIGLRGPGETQLETDRRLIRKRIRTIKMRLEKIRQQRQEGRKQRRRSAIPTVSLVGYTNTGKSTLFNYLTGASVFAADKLFATLDPTLRRFEAAPDVPVILTDTVGFIRHIPHDLIEAFHATLDETREADLLLHVIDVNDDERHAHIEQVNQVIHQIGAGAVQQIEVYNKIDLQQDLSARTEFNSMGEPHRVWLSARTGEGMEGLIDAVCQYLAARTQRHRLCLPATAGKLRAHLFDIGAVHTEHADESGGWIMEVDMETLRLYQLCQDCGVDDIQLQSCRSAL